MFSVTKVFINFSEVKVKFKVKTAVPVNPEVVITVQAALQL